jgi:hypothetical protein
MEGDLPNDKAPPSLEWSTWIDAAEAATRKGPFAHFGIYQIRAVKPGGEPIPIPRLAGIDPSGTIYIGRSGFERQGTDRFVSNRIREFLNRQHSGGQTYFIACVAIHKHPAFSEHALQVRACRLPDSAIEHAEDVALTQYLMQFGELPPCNSTMPKLKRMLF